VNSPQSLGGILVGARASPKKEGAPAGRNRWHSDSRSIAKPSEEASSIGASAARRQYGVRRSR
jgi:hypothetical protein